MRTFGKIKLSAQRDTDWRQLSHTAQWLYWALIGSEKLTACGAMDYKPKHLAALSPTMTVDGVEGAMDELREHHFVVLDDETDELLLRSFVRNDDVVLNRNMMVAVVKAGRKLASLRLIGVLAFELLRLRNEFPQAGIWEHPEMIDMLRRATPVDVRQGDLQSDDGGALVSVGAWSEDTENPY
ncbi:helix-turn-helix DNA binding domain protein [Arthrobacter phage Pippa]|nr:helix-turn-helix DNA binding domain protein [Arthrobacter phage Pippa]